MASLYKSHITGVSRDHRLILTIIINAQVCLDVCYSLTQKLSARWILLKLYNNDDRIILAVGELRVATVEVDSSVRLKISISQPLHR